MGLAVCARLAIIVAGMGLPPAPDDDPARLIDALGAGRFVDRQAAEAALLKLGTAALPALHDARKSAKDPEVRARAIALGRRIETAAMLTGTPVSVPDRDPSISTLMQILEAAGALPVKLDRDLPSGLASRPIRLDAATGPMPFWEALGRLERAAGLSANLEPMDGPNGAASLFGIRLADAHGHVMPTSVHGPLRVTLRRLGLQSERSFEPDAPADAVVQLVARLRVTAEPRLVLGHAGPPRVIEARDEAGNSLLRAVDGPPDQPAGESLLPDVEYTDGPELTQTLRLAHPQAQLGGTIAVLRGELKVALAKRRRHPIVVKLDAAEGKEFQGDELILGVNFIQQQPESRRRVIEIQLKPSPDSGVASSEFLYPSVPGLVEHQVEAIDADGRPVNALLIGSEQLGEILRMRLALVPIEGSGAAVSITFYSLTRGIAAVPFHFENVPLP